MARVRCPSPTPWPARRGSCENYWLGILKDSNLKNTFGEISLKKYDGAIHLSLPYFSGTKGWVQGSAREKGSDGVYRSLTTLQIANYLNKTPGTQGTPVAEAGIGMWTGILVLLAGAGAFIYAKVRR